MDRTHRTAASAPAWQRAGRDGEVRGAAFHIALALAGLQFLLCLSFALLTPLYEGPDETAHADLVLFTRTMAEWPEPRGLRLSQRIVNSRARMGWEGGLRARGADEAVPRSGRPPLGEIAGEGRNSTVNHVTNHPPAYYVLMGTALPAVSAPWTVFGHLSHDELIMLIRVLNAALIAPVPVLVYQGVRTLRASRSVALTGAVIPLAIPQLAFTGGTINNDNLLVLTFTLTGLVITRVLAGDLRARTATLLGLVAGIALLTKAFALVLPVWIVLAYLLHWLRSEEGEWSGALRGLALSLTVAFAVGGWWYVRSMARFDTLVPAGVVRGLSARQDPSFVEWFTGAASRLNQSFWGNFGRLDVPVPPALAWVATALLAGAVMGALIVYWRRRRWYAMTLACLLVPFVAVVLSVGANQWSEYSYHGRFFGLQGRYLFGGVFGVAIVAAEGMHRAWRRGSGRLPAFVLVAAVLFQVYALALVVGAFWQPVAGGALLGRMRTVLVWSPWPAASTVAVLAAAVGTAAWAVYRTAALGRATAGGTPGDP